MALTVRQVADLLAERGRVQYGNEAVSQLEHALQCAHLAEQSGEIPATIVAAMLHDLGHLLARQQEGQQEGRAGNTQERDDLHQYAALPFLRGLLPDSVIEPIRMHVDAKRWLCATEPGYSDTLSPASIRSLELQGGIYSAAQAGAFMGQAFATEATRLRRYDDLAKVPQRATPTLAHFIQMLDEVAVRQG